MNLRSMIHMLANYIIMIGGLIIWSFSLNVYSLTPVSQDILRPPRGGAYSPNPEKKTVLQKNDVNGFCDH